MGRIAAWCGAAARVASAWALLACQQDTLVYTGPLPAPPVNATASATPPVPKASVVLLRRFQGLLVAVACYDGKSGELRVGDTCAALIPDGAEVHLADLRTARVRRAPLLTCRTASSEVAQPTLKLLEEPPAGETVKPAPPVALWSSGARPTLELPPWPPVPTTLQPSESLAIIDSVRPLLPVPQRLLLGQPLADNVWLVDLDADGLRERLDQARLFELRGRYALLSGVFVISGLEAVAMRPLHVQIIPSADRERLGREDHNYDVTMLAAVDLDHDGRRELWLQLRQPGQTTDTVGRYTDGGFAAFAELTCPIDEPPSKPAPKSPPAAVPRPR